MHDSTAEIEERRKKKTRPRPPQRDKMVGGKSFFFMFGGDSGARNAKDNRKVMVFSLFALDVFLFCAFNQARNESILNYGF